MQALKKSPCIYSCNFNLYDFFHICKYKSIFGNIAPGTVSLHVPRFCNNQLVTVKHIFIIYTNGNVLFTSTLIFVSVKARCGTGSFLLYCKQQIVQMLLRSQFLISSSQRCSQLIKNKLCSLTFSKQALYCVSVYITLVGTSFSTTSCSLLRQKISPKNIELHVSF